jgi:hypothetical protein
MSTTDNVTAEYVTVLLAGRLTIRFTQGSQGSGKKQKPYLFFGATWLPGNEVTRDATLQKCSMRT